MDTTLWEEYEKAALKVTAGQRGKREREPGYHSYPAVFKKKAAFPSHPQLKWTRDEILLFNKVSARKVWSQTNKKKKKNEMKWRKDWKAPGKYPMHFFTALLVQGIFPQKGASQLYYKINTNTWNNAFHSNMYQKHQLWHKSQQNNVFCRNMRYDDIDQGQYVRKTQWSTEGLFIHLATTSRREGLCKLTDQTGQSCHCH